MPYTLPNFNLLCNIWHNPAVPPAAPTLANVPCQLYLPLKANSDVVLSGFLIYRVIPQCRLPKGTDVRYSPSGANPNILEVPAGSGRNYVVTQVEDAHKGFPNEYRVAFLKEAAPVPAPLP